MDYSRLTKVQLQNLLRERGLKVSGNKPDLIQRLIELDQESSNNVQIGIPQRSTSQVVCVKVASIRPGYQNLKEWMEDPNNVYIGRAGIVFIDKVRYPKQSSIWANPFKVGKDGTREEVIEKYRTYILGKIASDPKTYNLETLRGKTLGCWCKPEGCHGDVLVELLE